MEMLRMWRVYSGTFSTAGTNSRPTATVGTKDNGAATDHVTAPAYSVAGVPLWILFH